MEKKTIDSTDEVTLRGAEWSCTPAKGTIVLVHGLGEHIGRYGHVVAFLNEHGWRVVAFDQRGHGTSGGERGRIGDSSALLVDLSGVVDLVRREHPGPLVLLGHSMGGLVAARYVAEKIQAGSAAAWSRGVDALVLSSPALDLGMNAAKKALLAVLAPLAPHVGIGNGLKAAWISRDPSVVAAYEADPLVHDRIAPRLVQFLADACTQVQRAAPRWNVPTLLLYAGADRCVVPAGSAAFAAAAPKGVVTSRVFPSLFHEIFNEPERAEVLSVLGGWLDTLPLSLFRSPQ